MDLQTLYNNVNQLISGWTQFEDDVFDAVKPDLIDINAEQLNVGDDAEGSAMPEYANSSYARFKLSRGSRSNGRWDLNLTGSFQSKMKINDDGQIFSTDSKARKLTDITNSLDLDIFGVQKDRLSQYNKEYAAPMIKDMILERLTK